MNITCSTWSQIVDVKDYSVTFSSGIKWRNIGGVWAPLDRGNGTAKYSTDITIQGQYNSIINIRKAMLYDAEQGLAFQIQCQPFERVFGPEFWYTLPYNCVLDVSETPYTTDELGTATYTTWKFTLHALDFMPTYYIYQPSSMPVGAWIQSMDRSKSGAFITASLESAVYAAGFGHESPTTVVHYAAPAATAAKYKAYLQAMRSAPLTFNFTPQWLFDPAATLNTVYIMDVQDEGPEDVAGINHRFSVTYGRIS